VSRSRAACLWPPADRSRAVVAALHSKWTQPSLYSEVRQAAAEALVLVEAPAGERRRRSVSMADSVAFRGHHARGPPAALPVQSSERAQAEVWPLASLEGAQAAREMAHARRWSAARLVPMPLAEPLCRSIGSTTDTH
jgi:hypothetical protein